MDILSFYSTIISTTTKTGKIKIYLKLIVKSYNNNYNHNTNTAIKYHQHLQQKQQQLKNITNVLFLNKSFKSHTNFAFIHATIIRLMDSFVASFSLGGRRIVIARTS